MKTYKPELEGQRSTANVAEQLNQSTAASPLRSQLKQANFQEGDALLSKGLNDAGAKATTTASLVKDGNPKAPATGTPTPQEMVLTRHKDADRAALEAGLADSATRAKVAGWSTDDLKWLVAISRRPLGPNVAATFDAAKGRVWGNVDGLTALLEVRFGVDVKKEGQAMSDTDPRKAQAFSLSGIQRIWTTLSQLPAADVECADFKDLIRVDHDKDTGIFGGYGGDAMQLGYTETGANRDLSDSKVLGTNKKLKNVKQFEHTVRHELGHAMDVTYGITSKFQGEDAFGGWAFHGQNVTPMLIAAVATFADAEKTAKADADAAAKTPSDAKKLEAATANLNVATAAKTKEQSIYAATAKSTEQIDVSKADTAEGATPAKANPMKLMDALSKAGPSAWPLVKDKIPGLKETVAGKRLEQLSGTVHYTIESPIAIGGRVYAYETGAGVNGWMSYSESARSKKVSNFQFKSPREWFAEVYASYYDDVAKPGESLANVDPTSKRFIDELRKRMEKDSLVFHDRDAVGDGKEGTRSLNDARLEALKPTK